MLRIAIVSLLLIPCVATEAAAAPFKPGGSYSGTTDQGKKVTEKVSADGAKLKRFKIAWSADCGSKTLRDSTVFEDFDLPAGGTLDIRGPYEDDAFGLTGSHNVVLQGRFRHAGGKYTVSGTFKDVIAVGSPASTEHYRCKTGKVHWSAKI